MFKTKVNAQEVLKLTYQKLKILNFTTQIERENSKWKVTNLEFLEALLLLNQSFL
jgi:hypothetical protein